MFTEAQKKQLLEWEEYRKADGSASGFMVISVDSIPIRQLAAFQKAGIVTKFKDYGKGHQKCILVDVRMLIEAVKKISSPKSSSKEWLLIQRFKECLEANPKETERVLQLLEYRIEKV